MSEIVTDKSNSKKYFTQVCNFIEDLDLSPLAFRLYFYYKRWANSTHKNQLSVKEMCNKFRVGSPKIALAKQELVGQNLITVDDSGNKKGLPDKVEILDVWQRNFEHFQKQEPVAIQRQTPRQVATRPLAIQRGDPSPDSDALKKEIKEKERRERKLKEKENTHTVFHEGKKIKESVCVENIDSQLFWDFIQNKLMHVPPIDLPEWESIIKIFVNKKLDIKKFALFWTWFREDDQFQKFKSHPVKPKNLIKYLPIWLENQNATNKPTNSDTSELERLNREIREHEQRFGISAKT